MHGTDSQKGFAPVVIILVVITVLGLGAGGFALISKNKTSSSSPSSPSAHAPTSKGAVVSTDPKLLEGLWRIETAYGFVNPPGVWEESEDIKVDTAYQEFKNGTMCRIWTLRIFEPLTGRPTLEQAFDKKYCSEYGPYRALTPKEYKSKNKEVGITFADQQYGTAYTWKIVGSKLEFENSGARGIYVKIPGTRDIATEIKDTAKLLITSFTVNHPAFGVGDEVGLKCVASEERAIKEFNISVAGIGPNNSSFNTASDSGPDDDPGHRSKTFTFTARVAGTYTATCKAADDRDNQSDVATVKFSVN